MISANGAAGVSLDGADFNLLARNYIGTNFWGTSSLPNVNSGISLYNSDFNTIGGNSSTRNLISGNRGDGITMTYSDSNLVAGNYIGTDLTGANLLLGTIKGNGENGISLTNSSSNTIGGGMGAGNVISASGQLNQGANSNNGLFIFGNASSGNLVQSNTIGGGTMTVNLGNMGDGVYISGAGAGNVVGGNNAMLGNTITRNNGFGIDLQANVTEDFNTIGSPMPMMNWMNNLAGGSMQGIFGPNDQHQ